MRTVSLEDVAAIERTTVAPDQIGAQDTYVGLENITSEGTFVGVSAATPGELKSNKFRFDDGHVLFGKLRPYLSKIAAPDFAGVCSTDILPIRPGNELERRYLLHFLRTPAMVAEAARLSEGANLPRLSPKLLALFEIPLPPLDEQRRIAAILDAAEVLRAKRREAIAELQNIPQSIFIEIFGDLVSNERGWPTASLSDVCAVIQIGPFGSLLHQSEYISGGVPIVNPMHIVDGSIAPRTDQTVTVEKRDELKSYTLMAGDVVMGRRGEMGRCAVVRPAEEGWLCGSGSLFFRPDRQRISPLVLAATLSGRSGRDLLERLSQGVTMANLNSGMLESLTIGVPAISAQVRFERFIDCHAATAQAYANSSQILDRLFASLSQCAFRGDL